MFPVKEGHPKKSIKKGTTNVELNPPILVGITYKIRDGTLGIDVYVVKTIFNALKKNSFLQTKNKSII